MSNRNNDHSDPGEEVTYIGGSGGGYFPQVPHGDRADFVDKIKPEALPELIRHRLMGQELIDGNWINIPELKDRKLTDVGAWEISNLMLGVASLNVSISKLNDDEIKMRANNIARSALTMCLVNYGKYGIKESSMLSYINQLVFTNTYVVLKQADGASIQELLKGTVNEQRLIQSEQKKPGMIKRILGFG
jgi:hypothetical protein